MNFYVCQHITLLTGRILSIHCLFRQKRGVVVLKIKNAKQTVNPVSGLGCPNFSGFRLKAV